MEKRERTGPGMLAPKEPNVSNVPNVPNPSDSMGKEKKKQGVMSFAKQQIKDTCSIIYAYFFSTKVDLDKDSEDYMVKFDHQEHAIGHLMGYINKPLKYGLYILLCWYIVFWSMVQLSSFRQCNPMLWALLS